MRPQTVLILKADRLYADAICRRAHEVWPHATYHLENSVDAAQALVAHRRIDAVLTGLGMLDGDVCNLVDDCSRQSVPAMIALITGRRDPRLLALLGQLPIDGAFDSKEEPPEHLPAALETVARGEGFFSRSFLARMSDRAASGPDIFRLLTPQEQLILAVIGDGCDDPVAAGRLGVGVATIHAARRSLHDKLGIQHKGELMRLAVSHGFVRFTERGVERLGFTRLVADYNASPACRKPCRPTGDVSQWGSAESDRRARIAAGAVEKDHLRF